MSTARFLTENARPLLAGTVLSYGSSYGQTFFIAIFAPQVMVATGLSHGGWGLVYLVATTLSALLMIWAGGLADRVRIGPLAAVCTAGLTLACLGMAAATGVMALGAAVLALRFFGQGMMSHVAAVAMSRWFAAGRGRALAVASVGFAIGQAALPVLFVALLEIAHWRMLWVVAALTTAFLVPFLLWAARGERAPEELASDAAARGMDGRHWRRGEAVRDPVLWMVLPMVLGPAAWGTALFFHQAHIAEVKGFGLAALVALFPLYVGGSLVSTLVSGAALDRYGAARLLPLLAVPMAIGFALMGSAESLWSTGLALTILGIGWGAQATMPAAFWAEAYGTAHLGSIKAFAGAAMVFGSALGPGLTGWLIDRGTDFPEQMIWYAGYFALAGILTWAATRRVRIRLPRPDRNVLESGAEPRPADL